MSSLSCLADTLSLDEEKSDKEIEVILNDALQICKMPTEDTSYANIEPFLQSSVKLLQREDVSEKCLALNLEVIAELAKTDSARTPCVDVGLLDEVIHLLDISNNTAVILQALRCIGNICADNGRGREKIQEKDGTRKIIEKISTLQEQFSETELDNISQLHLTACGSICNLISDCESLQTEAITLGVVPFLLGFVKDSDDSASDFKVCEMAVSALSILIDTVDGKTEFLRNEGGIVLVSALKKFDLSSTTWLEDVLEILKAITADNDDPKLELVKAGVAEPLLSIVKNYEQYNEEDDSEWNVLKSAADLTILLLSGDESMKEVWEQSNSEEMMNDLLSWFHSCHDYIRTSAALAVGNLARSDENCLMLLNLGVHEKLLSLLNSSDSTAYSLHQAILSSLRNLAMPVQAKPVLIEAGLVNVVLPYLHSEQMMVQFKTLATLRFIVSGQGQSAIDIGCKEASCKRIIELSTASGAEGVIAEASRLLAAVIKNSNNSDVVKTVIKCDGLKALVSMVNSQHALMQIEALIALALCVSNMSDDDYPNIQNCGCVEAIMIVLRNPISNPQSCYNGIATLEALWLRGYCKDFMLSAGLEDILKTLSTHSVQPLKSRAGEFLQRIS